MPRVDFHSQVSDKLHYTCRLIRKARAANCTIVVYGTALAELQKLDQQLWDFSAVDFLPHVFLDDQLAQQTPVILTTELRTALPHRQILINLSREIPDNYTQFERVIEIVSTDNDDAQAARQRFRHYQHEGIQPSHTVASTS
ncbi:MAG: DNA polymerase III subunit chi [Burkholderiaceae bacterium]|nr:MAG: DNA polymerase III subunit chi [Burkholderiaceae bacterium]